MTPEKLPRGITRTAQGWRIFVSIHGARVRRRCPSSWTLAEVKDYREAMRTDIRRGAPALVPGNAPPATFEDDVARYLAAVRAMPSFVERQRHILHWLDELGTDRSRATMDAALIDAVMQRWLAEGMHPTSVKHRRTALRHLWNKLDGRDARNPVKATTPPPRVPTEPRALDYALVARLLERIRGAKTRARLAVIAYTGIPHQQIRQLRPSDLDTSGPEPSILIQGRRKGAGTETRRLPLTTLGLAAVRLLFAAHGHGPGFSPSSARGSLLRAAKWLRETRGVAVPEGIRPYDLRHSFAAHLYAETHDLATVARFLGHRDLATTQRYADGAIRSVDQATVVKLNAAWAKVPTPVAYVSKKSLKAERLDRRRR